MTDTNVMNLFVKIAQKVEPEKKFPAITADLKFSAMGLDSIAMMEIIGEIEDELDISIPDEKLATLQTVGDIEQAVLAQMQK